MNRHLHSRRVAIGLAVLAATLLGACSAARLHAMAPDQPPLRFLLTFDDGPSIRSGPNPTSLVLQTLASNPLQPGIKAVFFVQTRATNGGGTPQGRALMQQELALGHVLGFHTATPGHSSHLRMSSTQLRDSLHMGLADHTDISGGTPRLVRPPMWAYDDRTLGIYADAGLHALITDVTANDGKIVWPNGSPRRRQHMHYQMALLQQRVLSGELPVVDGVMPVIVTFHDPNPFTAEHLGEYLELLVSSARRQGLRVSDRPFYGEGEDIEHVALARTTTPGSPVQHVPGFWQSLLRIKP